MPAVCKAKVAMLARREKKNIFLVRNNMKDLDIDRFLDINITTLTFWVIWLFSVTSSLWMWLKTDDLQEVKESFISLLRKTGCVEILQASNGDKWNNLRGKTSFLEHFQTNINRIWLHEALLDLFFNQIVPESLTSVSLLSSSVSQVHITQYADSVASHLAKILDSDKHSDVISSAK